ncbi:MAG: hypothetical protein J6Z34_01500 [Clostridia bacterium]|nr:hypothetical protein [Clostridia bacterium]
MIKTVKTKVFGKINVGLNVLGKNGGYHDLDTVVATVNLYDVITVTTRRDKAVNLSARGFSSQIPLADNNVYKAAAAFIEKYSTYGADVSLVKNIPAGSGLGGSSADIVGVIKGMAKAYGITDDLKPLINSLCSDGEFLLEGGFARINGKGSVAEKFSVPKPLYLTIAVPDDCVSATSSVFEKFDSGAFEGVGADINGIVNTLKNGGFVKGEVFNALYAPAADLNVGIKTIYEKMKSLNPVFVSMSGSGSAVYGCFESVELCMWAKEKTERFCKTVYVKETINP